MTVLPAAPDPGLLDAEAIQRLRELDPGGGNQLLTRVVAAFSTSLDRLLPELAAARASEPIDLACVHAVSHTLKSSTASLGALALSRRCARIEAQAREGLGAGLNAQLDAMLDDIAQVRVALAALLAPPPP